MTDADGAAPSETGLNALVEALDRRARQAGTEGASTVLRGMVATITEVLGGLEERLDRIEQGVGDARSAEAAEVRGSLAGLHDRIGRLEEAFLRAVESSTEGSDAMLGEIRAAVEATVADRSPAAPADLAQTVTVRLGELAERVGALDQRLGEAAARADTAASDDPRHAEVLAGVAHLADVVRGLEARIERAEQARTNDTTARAAQEALTAVQAELARLGARLGAGERDERALAAITELRTVWEANYDRLDRAVGAVRTAVESGAPAGGSVPELATAAQLRELEAVIERVGRNDSAGRLVGLVEARLSAALDAMVARTDSAIDASRVVRDAVDAANGRIAELLSSVERLTAELESLGARLERETARALDDVGRGIADRLGAIADQQSRDLAAAHDVLGGEIGEIRKVTAEAEQNSGEAAEAVAARVGDALQREAELLTQRIAAVAKAVEGLRVSLEEHVRRSENTFGRRAGEVGRRLAVDFGLRTRADEKPDSARELGRGP